MLGYCSSLALSHFFAQSIIGCQRKLRFIIRAWQHISLLSVPVSALYVIYLMEHSLERHYFKETSDGKNTFDDIWIQFHHLNDLRSVEP